MTHGHAESPKLWRILPRDVETLTFCQRIWVSRMKPVQVKLLAGEQKVTEQKP